MSQNKTRIQLKRRLKASVETVFDAWTKPNQLKEWMSPGDVTVGSVVAEEQEGGLYSVEMLLPDGNAAVVKGKYLEFSRPNRLQFSWQWQMDGSVESVVTVELSEVGDGTECVLTHEQLKDEESVAKHTHGWEGCLQKLMLRYS